MAWYCLGVTLLLSVWATGKSENIPDGVLQMECCDRYLMIAVALPFTATDTHFEAVDETGVYPITKQYAAKCGYTIRVLPLLARMQFRAAYFSCHAENEDDKVFTFNFNLITTHQAKKLTYALNKTCSPALPWSPREVTCETNYMEVSVRSDVACQTGIKRHDWDAVAKTAYASATSDWQVMFQRVEQELVPMSFVKAHKQGYAFDLTDGRLVFRTPYGQPDSLSTEVNGVPVEVVRATLFSRQRWIILIVDLVAACSMDEGSYDDRGYMVWETPDALYPGLHSTKLNIGLNGELEEQRVAVERGYILKKRNTTLQISIPYNAKGGYRKSFVSGNLYEFYIFDLYLEQISVDEDHVETRLRFQGTLATPVLPHPVFTANRTVLEERTFTIYLGDVPEDVELAAVNLNGQEHTVPFTNESSRAITNVVYPNNTHGYTLKVPFDDPDVIQQYSREDAVLYYRLDINYTLTVLPENELYYHLASIEALFTDVYPPSLDAACSESGISFKLDHRPFGYLWELRVGSDPLTSELAAQHGYIMSNDSQSLLLNVPLFTHGYKYKDVTLKGFSGTFEVIVWDREASEVQSSAVTTCLFSAPELIMCSTDGRMTVVADLSLAVPSGGVPARTNLLDKHCGPREADDTRALFSFPVNSCGSIVKLGMETVTYENQIFFSKTLHAVKHQADLGNEIDRVRVQCTYALDGLSRTVYRFQSEEAGVGHIVHSSGGLRSPVIQLSTVPQKPVPISRKRVSIRRGYRPPAKHIRVSSFLKNRYKKGARGSKPKGISPYHKGHLCIKCKSQ